MCLMEQAFEDFETLVERECQGLRAVPAARNAIRRQRLDVFDERTEAIGGAGRFLEEGARTSYVVAAHEGIRDEAREEAISKRIGLPACGLRDVGEEAGT